MKPLLWWSVVLVAGCSSSTTIEANTDAGSAAQGGSAGNPDGAGGSGGSGANGQGGTAGASGAAGAAGASGAVGAAGSGATGQGGSAGTSGGTGTGGAAGSGGVSDGGGNAGAAGAGGACSPTNVTVDFAAQGNVQRDMFAQAGVSIVGSSDLQFSDANSTTSPNGGLGVVGGLYNWSVDNEEFVSLTFSPRPATNVKYYVAGGLDVDHDGIFGKTMVSAIGETGNSLGSLTITDIGSKNVSALFGNVPITKLTIAAAGEDGVVLGNLSFSACLQ